MHYFPFSPYRALNRGPTHRVTEFRNMFVVGAEGQGPSLLPAVQYIQTPKGGATKTLINTGLLSAL